jgi:hypothetical protein
MKFSSISHGLSIIERPKNVINKNTKRERENKENEEMRRRGLESGDEKIIKREKRTKGNSFKNGLNKEG